MNAEKVGRQAGMDALRRVPLYDLAYCYAEFTALYPPRPPVTIDDLSPIQRIILLDRMRRW